MSPFSRIVLGLLLAASSPASAFNALLDVKHGCFHRTHLILPPRFAPSQSLVPYATSPTTTCLHAMDDGDANEAAQHYQARNEQKLEKVVRKFLPSRQRLAKVLICTVASLLLLFFMSPTMTPSSTVANARLDASTRSAAKVSHFLTSRGTLDIGRAKMRLEGLQSYGTICALLMNACLRLSTSIKEPSDAKLNTRRSRFHRAIYAIFTLCVISSVIFGSYTTIVFTMISLYSKQALGRGLDEGFLNFYEATHVFRDSGFRSFLYCLIGFQGAFILGLILQLDPGTIESLGMFNKDGDNDSDRRSDVVITDARNKQMKLLRRMNMRRVAMVGLAATAAFVSFWRWSTVMQLANRFIYSIQD